MADQQLGINQGDHIYYYDLSAGAISRDWTFHGGTPTGGTAYGPDVRYYGVNYSGYSTGLVITGAGGITAAAYKSNIIVVYPEYFEPSIVITYNTTEIMDSPMGRNVTYSAGGSASSGYSMYDWVIPQLGATSGPLLSSVNYTCTDWYTLTGSYLGSPNASYLSDVGLDVTSVAGNESAITTPLNFRKIGVEETVDYWSPGTYATAGKYYNVSTLSQRTSVLGLGGDSLIFKINLAPYSPKWDNVSFHSTQEAVFLWPNSPDISKTYSLIKTNIILSGSALSSAGMTGGYTAKAEVMSGNYITPGSISSLFDNRFYITDNLSGNTFTSLVDSLRKWIPDAINDFIESKYYLSGSSKFIELGGYQKVSIEGGGLFEEVTFIRPPAANLASGIGYINNYQGYVWDGGFGSSDGYGNPPESYHGVSIPSGAMIEEQYGPPSDVDVDIRLTLRDSAGSVITDFEFVVSSFGNSGNSPDGYLITASDTSFGSLSGIAALINSGIASQPGSLDNNIIFESIGYLSPYYDGGALGIYGSNSFFGGIKMSIKDPKTSSTYSNRYIHSLEIQWGSQMSDFISDGIIDGIEFPTVPLASPIENTGSLMASWTGLPSKITVPSSTYSSYFRGWKIGGSL